ncbi:uncharacterized protein [Diadema antillarum]|uniref:uncharacterized protein n=1 Tax=Diadema antillarum TaxID=105358 RepID=UPI003A842ED7
MNQSQPTAPPPYHSPAPPPVYHAGQVAMISTPQTPQVAPPLIQERETCCTGIEDHYPSKAGHVTGTLQIIIGIFSIIFAVIPYFVIPYHVYPGTGTPIAAAVFFYIPTGILGVVSRHRQRYVIIAYLVMAIFSAFYCFVVMGVESCAAIFYSFTYDCSYYYCFWRRENLGSVFHGLGACLSFVEFVVAVVAASYCCHGLACCGCCGPARSTAPVSHTTAAAAAPTVFYHTAGMTSQLPAEAHIVTQGKPV